MNETLFESRRIQLVQRKIRVLKASYFHSFFNYICSLVPFATNLVLALLHNVLRHQSHRVFQGLPLVTEPNPDHFSVVSEALRQVRDFVT